MKGEKTIKNFSSHFFCVAWKNHIFYTLHKLYYHILMFFFFFFSYTYFVKNHGGKSKGFCGASEYRVNKIKNQKTLQMTFSYTNAREN